MDSMKAVAIVIGSLVSVMLFIAVVSFLSTGFSIANLKFWGPQEQAAERQIYEESPSRVHGMAQRLYNYKQEYREAEREDDEDRAENVRQLVLHQYGNYDRSKLPDHLVEFLEELEEVQ